MVNRYALTLLEMHSGCQALCASLWVCIPLYLTVQFRRSFFPSGAYLRGPTSFSQPPSLCEATLSVPMVSAVQQSCPGSSQKKPRPQCGLPMCAGWRLGGGRLDESCACLPPPHMHHLAVLRSGAASVLMTRNEWTHGGICRNTSSKATAKASLSIQVPTFWSLPLPGVPAQLTGWSSLGDPRPRQLPRNIPSPFLRAGLSPEALGRSWWGSLVPDPPVTAPRATSIHSWDMETVPGIPRY